MAPSAPPTLLAVVDGTSTTYTYTYHDAGHLSQVERDASTIATYTYDTNGNPGVFDASEVMNITIELVRRGYSEEDIEKIWGGNLMRVFRDVQSVAQEIQAEGSA